MRRYLVIGLVIALVGIAAYIAYDYLVFRVVSTTPSQKSQLASPYDPISISFNHDLAETYTPKDNQTGEPVNSVLTQPTVAGTIQVIGKKLIFTPAQPLDINTHYTFSFIGLSSLRGEHVDNLTLSFTTSYNAPVSADTQARLKKQTDQSEDSPSKRDLLIQKLPISQANFTISYVDTSASFEVQITAAPAASAKSAAIAYLRANGATDDDIKNASFYVLPSVDGHAGP